MILLILIFLNDNYLLQQMYTKHKKYVKKKKIDIQVSGLVSNIQYFKITSQNIKLVVHHFCQQI